MRLPSKWPPKAFELASRLVQLTPPGMDHVFFANSGSEAIDTAPKTVLAYRRTRGEDSRVKARSSRLAPETA
jgi:beta-alanine--pyruvate transaminase